LDGRCEVCRRAGAVNDSLILFVMMMKMFKPLGSLALFTLSRYASKSMTSLFHFKCRAASLLLASASGMESEELLLRGLNLNYILTIFTMHLFALSSYNHVRLHLDPQSVPIFHTPLIDSHAVSKSMNAPLMMKKIL
jgi:hypothetical protein